MAERFAERIKKNYPNGYTTDVTNCARCGENHSGLVFGPLTNPSDEWMFWTMCPNLKEPILGAIVETPRTMSALEALDRKRGEDG